MQYLVMIYVAAILIASGKVFTPAGAFAFVCSAFFLLKEKEAQKVCVALSIFEIVHAVA